MPRFSAFTPFGHLAFSARKPKAQAIFEGMRSALGGEENCTLAFDNSHAAATLYARARAIATADLTLTRARTNMRPSRSLEALPTHERDFGVVRQPGASDDQRRAALAAAELLPNGASETNTRDALAALLGSDFIALRYLLDGEFSVSPGSWYLPVWGNWAPPWTAQKWHRLTANIDDPGASLIPPETSVVHTEYVAGSEDPFVTGEILTIEPGVAGLTEVVEVTAGASGGSSFSAAFLRGHAAGALVTSTPWPNATTTSRYVLVVCTSAAARSVAVRDRVAGLARKIGRATEMWAVVEETTPGTLGPFKVGEGLIGITPIGALATIP
jgi:hypothetical protein